MPPIGHQATTRAYCWVDPQPLSNTSHANYINLYIDRISYSSSTLLKFWMDNFLLDHGISLCTVGSIPGPYILGASSNMTPCPKIVTIKVSPDIVRCLLGGKIIPAWDSLIHIVNIFNKKYWMWWTVRTYNQC